MLIYGKERKSETDLEIGEIKKALNDFAKQNEQKQGKTKQYKNKQNKFKTKSRNWKKEEIILTRHGKK